MKKNYIGREEGGRRKGKRKRQAVKKGYGTVGRATRVDELFPGRTQPHGFELKVELKLYQR